MGKSKKVNNYNVYKETRFSCAEREIIASPSPTPVGSYSGKILIEFIDLHTFSADPEYVPQSFEELLWFLHLFNKYSISHLILQ